MVVDAAGEIYGDAPNTAARVQALAEPDTVVVTARVQRQIAGLFVTEERGTHDLKGVPEPVTLFRLVRASGGGRRAGQRHLTPLIGREEEIAVLMRRWERARQGDGQLVLIVGEPGLGKSRLVEEFHARLRDMPHTWAEWSCSQLLQNTPLHPIADWGHQRFGGADVPAEKRLGDLENLLGLVKLDPGENAALLAPLLDIPLPPERALALPPEELRRRQLAALTSLVIAGARAQPAVLALEDLHWSDPTTLDLLRGIAERGALAPLFVLITARPEFRPPWGMRSHHSTISLAPLDRAQVRNMVGELAVRHALPKEVIDRVTERTGGVPLFVEELTRLLLERGEQGDIQAIPPTLQQSLMARLDRLGPAREVATDRRCDRTRLLLAPWRGWTMRRCKPLWTGSPTPTSSWCRAYHRCRLSFQARADPGRGLRESAQEPAPSTAPPRRRDLARQVRRHRCSRAGVAGASLHRGWHDRGRHRRWGKAGQRSLERSALVEAAAQFTRALDQIAALPATPALRREQIRLQVALIAPLLHVKGHAAPETKAAAERARLLIEQAEALGEAPEDPLLLFSVLYSVWLANYIAFHGDVMCELARQFLAFAEKQGATAPLLIAHRIMGISLLCTGDIREGRAHLDQAIALYDPAEHRPLASRFSVDARQSILSYRSWTLWVLGYPEAALADADQTVSDAREIGQAVTLMHALAHAPFTYCHCGNYATAKVQCDEAIALADEKGTLFWKAWAMMNQGGVSVLTGKASDAVATIISAITMWRSTEATAHLPLSLTYLTRAYAELGQFDDARRCIGEAMTAVKTTKESWCEAEVNRIAGEVALKSPEPDAAKAEAYFERALAVAREQQAKSWELRASMSLARLWRDQGKVQQARELLAPVYGWFTEGFDTRDLKEAKALLEQLAI